MPSSVENQSNAISRRCRSATGASSISTGLLDTCVLIDLVPGSFASVDRRFGEALTAARPLMLSAVSIFEFRFGAERSRDRAAQLEGLSRIMSVVEIAAFDESDAVAAATIKAALAAAGRMIGPYDLLIAGQALARGWTLVTSNAREFARVEGLAVEDWRAEA
ncbi:MAG TPA: PIN domain-containing protein [Caulobacteraceae bacterium]|nr:PIN domain-containing protein [Caulobacteraceae bacterium]